MYEQETRHTWTHCTSVWSSRALSLYSTLFSLPSSLFPLLLSSPCILTRVVMLPQKNRSLLARGRRGEGRGRGGRGRGGTPTAEECRPASFDPRPLGLPLSRRIDRVAVIVLPRGAPRGRRVTAEAETVGAEVGMVGGLEAKVRAVFPTVREIHLCRTARVKGEARERRSEASE